MNFSSFLSLAACRTRSSACVTRTQPCVRCVLCPPRVPLGPRPWLRRLRSGRARLVRRATMAECDFSRSCIVGYGSSPSRHGPEQHAIHSGCWSTMRSPGSRTRSIRTCQGLRPRRVFEALATNAPRRFAFRKENCVGTRDMPLSRLDGWPMRSPANASPTPSRVTAHNTRGRCGSLHLHRGGLSPPTSCRRNRRFSAHGTTLPSPPRQTVASPQQRTRGMTLTPWRKP